MQRRPIWIKSRKNLLNQVKKQVLAFVGEDAEVNSYAEAYKREFFGRWERSSYQSLFADLNSAHFVLGGYFHAFSQSQRSHLRVLRHIVEQRQLIIAVECIESRYQEVLDQFLANSIDEKKFLNKVKWQSHWGFPWENYKPIFEFAKSFNIKMVAINRFYRKKNLAHLKNRDAHACRRLAAVHNTYPTALIYVIFGDLHLASEHLPKKLMTWLSEQKKSPKVVRVFLNSEKLYFKLAGQQLENQIEVMKSSRHRYCLLTSPPWVKWQGYLMYLEQAYDRDLLEDDIIDFTDRVGQLVSLIAKDVRVPVALKNLAVYRGADDNFWFHISNHLSVKDLKTVENLIVGDRSFLIPQLKIAFLSRASINHCAALAGYYVHTEL